VPQLASNVRVFPQRKLVARKVEKCTGLVDVFRRDPNRIAIAGRRAIIAPTRGGYHSTPSVVARKSIVGTHAFRRDVNLADTDLGINAA